MNCANRNIYIANEFAKLGKVEFYITDNIKREIKKIARIKGRRGILAKKILIMLKEINVKTLKSSKKNVDDELIEFSQTFEFIVATCDKDIIHRIKGNGGKYINLRQGKYIEID